MRTSLALGKVARWGTADADWTGFVAQGRLRTTLPGGLDLADWELPWQTRQGGSGVAKAMPEQDSPAQGWSVVRK